MRRLIGFIFFWTAAGIGIGLLIENILISVLLILFLLLLGYNLFMC